MLFILLFFIFIFGLIIGSFLNCLIWRLHKKEGLWNRSYCPKCRHQIAWYDNIPIFSFIVLRGRCRYCQKKISWQYPLVEFTTGFLFVLSFWLNFIIFFGSSDFFDVLGLVLNSKFLILNLRDWFVIAVLTIIFIYDLRWYLILDIITLPACFIVFLLNLYLGISWQNLLISGIIGSSFFLFQFVISKGKWIGGGDIRVGALMGFIFGWPLVLVALFLAYLIGSLVGFYLILAKKKGLKSEVPLGVFLSIASIITLFWGDQILGWYLKFLL